MNKGWRARLVETLTGLLAVAIVSRVVWELLRPLLPMVVAGVALLGLLRLMVGRYRQW